MRRLNLFICVMAMGYVFCKNPVSVGADELTTVIHKEEVQELSVECIEDIGELEETEESTSYLIDLTEEEIHLMARVVMSESSILNSDAKQAVAQTIVNRVRNGYWGDTVTEVINYPNAYSTHYNGDPTEECYRAVYGALMYEGFPTDMYYFKSGSPHNFGYEYTQIGNTYFTTETNHLEP